ncbi:MAG: GGDEF domain-containing protein [Bacteriovorax sp.]|nr:GGDEF domain-containing protein [Rhizobacter sp.]
MAASTSISLVINALLHRSPNDFWISMVTSAGIPALIAPPVTWLAMRLLIEADDARRAAESMAVTDALTGAFNRRHFFVAGERRFAHARRLHEPASLLLLDVDDFKAVNDLHGHALGDRVLIAVAQACMACMRESDLLARYGGEEFVALLPATDLTHALQVAERIRAARGRPAVQHRRRRQRAAHGERRRGDADHRIDHVRRLAGAGRQRHVPRQAQWQEPGGCHPGAGTQPALMPVWRLPHFHRPVHATSASRL